MSNTTIKTAAQTVLSRGITIVTSLFHRNSPVKLVDVPPPLFNSDLLNPDQLAQHARGIATTYATIGQIKGGYPLRPILDRNEQLIKTAHERLLEALRLRQEMTPAAEWLLDNMHVVVDQIREIRQDLPGGYYAELPKLTTGPRTGQPRVYAIAIELIKHTDGRIDLEQLLQFIMAYQSVTPLAMGELWAVVIMLRFGLVENLARLAGLVLESRGSRDLADTWVDRLLAEDTGSDMGQSPVLAALAQAYPTITSAFAMRLLQRLRLYDGERDIGAVVRWLEQQPVVPYNNIEALIHAEHQRQAINQVSIGNTITSMRMLSSIDWDDWFEQVCFVEHILRQDPCGAYGQSTFATRDQYRHIIEQLARRSGVSEIDVARRVVDLARTAPQDGSPRYRHVGYYLIDAGRTALESELGYHPTPAQAIQRLIMQHPTACYLGTLAIGTAATVAIGLKATQTRIPTQGSRGIAGSALPAALLLLPATALAKELLDRVVTTMLPPRVLPRLDLRNGIPPALRTIVVIPTLLLTADSVYGQVDALEVLALANSDPNLHFALLSDFADAPSPTMPDDDRLLAIARAGIEQLNERYSSDQFLLLHRNRIWNESQNCYMGWERKRGKLEEFNRLLTGADDTTFRVCIGDLSILPSIRYVITLDADTQLPRDAGRAMIGTIAHPLQHAEIDPQTRQVTQGYGILQPRVAITLPSAMRSRFARTFSGNVGIDPYTTAVSDVYMDLFGDGIYAGKGIYDPIVLRETLDHRFPEHTLLSHDLIEGSYARTGLLSDVELLDNYPSTYAAFAARQHRWVRGDWQISAWILPWVPSPEGLTGTVLSPIARYKILDNLRRSLIPPATIALLAHGWLGGRGIRSALATTTYALLPLTLPALFDLIGTMRAVVLGPDRLNALRTQAEHLRMSTLRFGLNITFLPDQAVSNLDAIIRTLTRLIFTKRNLLEWETAAEAHRRLTQSSSPMLRRMAPTAVLGVLAALLRARHVAQTWPSLVPVVTSWLSAPAIAAWLDRPALPERQALAADDRLLLRGLARTTWAYFEQFVTADANYLAPDNMQETPTQVIAYRTSPTNIGLQLLADLAAYDFGYIGVLELTNRTEQALATMAKLERYRGHLLNWYDTKTLQPLPPAYVSTVDSGNLAGFLLTLRQGYLSLRDQPIIGPQALLGIQDTLAVIQRYVPTNDEATLQQLSLLSDRAIVSLYTTNDYHRQLESIQQRASDLNLLGEAAVWRSRLVKQIQSLRDDLAILVPEQMQDNPPPTLRELAHAADQQLPLLARHDAIAIQTLADVEATDFTFLYEPQRRIFAIGFNAADGRRDNSYYDLLASEARLASFLTIAKGDVPQEHWFHLGRTLLETGAGAALASWSGTAFEYLMPLLVMHSYPNTLLDTTYQSVVARQIQYGHQQSIPWGVSESAYNARDLAMNYQYRAFGVPGLGLKRGLGSDLVVTPYATVLSLPIQANAAIANLKLLIEAGMLGRYGLYEAIDYTLDRLPPGATHTIIRSFMVHHQAMSLLAFANALHDNKMQQRFHAEALVQATETLLQERNVHAKPLNQPQEPFQTQSVVDGSPSTVREIGTATTPVPLTHLLSNGTYTVMLTNAGGGYSTSGDLAVTRWRSDPAQDNWGSFCYIRDVRSDLAWSAAYQPTRQASRRYHVSFGLEKVEFRQEIAGIQTRMEVSVSPEDMVEVRRISLTNLTSAPRELEVTSYAEIVLTPAAADMAHPAFSNLFIETEFVGEHNALLASRRPRSATTARYWALHTIAVRGHAGSVTEYETDRASFIGRGRTTADPQALHRPLTRSSGAVLDPIFSLRRRVRIVPGGTAQIVFTTGIAENREHALQLAEKYRDPESAVRAIALAWTQSQVELRHLNITAAVAQRFQQLATALIYMDGLKRAKPDMLERNVKGQSSLWAYGISGDAPIVLVRVSSGEDLSLVTELLQAHQYWRLKRLSVDLVILNEDAGGYLQGAQEHILGLVRSSGSSVWLNQRGGVFVLRSDLMPADDRILLETVARTLLTTRRGDLSQHLRRRDRDAPLSLPAPRNPVAVESQPLPEVLLHQRSTYGGFDANGEYVIDLAPGQVTPAPWSNVIANEQFGFLVTERGGGYTWVRNSRENRLTPWSNDPISDPPGEVIYLRDQDSGMLWSPTIPPAGHGPIRIRHGFGYSSFSQQSAGIASELRLSVAADQPVKFYRLHLKNTSDKQRSLSVTLYVEWVLGVFRAEMAPYIVTSFDQQSEALLARNTYNTEFGPQIAFLASSERNITIGGDRVEFIGRNGDLNHPAALNGDPLRGRVGAGFDPCGAIQCAIELAPNQERELVFLLGQAADIDQVRELIERYREPVAAANAEQQATERWQSLLGQVQVQTPQPELDLLLNGWLLYQTLVCRIWARSAFYQSGGAYGFRDQLQDVMALVDGMPDVAHAQILRASSRQFLAGDVQHWWHPPTGRGVRTRFSDDYLWLPFVVHHYITTTGDMAILDETTPFLEGRALNPDEAEYYDLPSISSEHGSCYEHCVRAIDYALGRIGAHGLPLMGAGDWNDGMNMVGHDGRGESVWVGWFLHINLEQFAPIALQRGDNQRATRYQTAARLLQEALEQHAWDGEWYLRAFFDDGTPLGAAGSSECKIDSLPQSWAVIAGSGDAARARRAMNAVSEHLVDHDAGLIKLFTPPFDRASHDPGYIQGYVPGVRENGGQYTHAAIWVIWAYAMLGDGAQVGKLLKLINPILHTQANADIYKVEPYTIAADVYAAPRHVGRGGWTWYTGSAGWFYRLGIEMVLGLRRIGNTLTLLPCIPPEWPGYSITYRFGQTEYHIQVQNPQHVATGIASMCLDGQAVPDGQIMLCDDRVTHTIHVTLGEQVLA